MAALRINNGNSILVTHPYLGYVFSPSSPNGEVTELGFRDPFFEEPADNKNTIIIGIFGGSVARNVGIFSTDIITEKLSAHQSFKGKHIYIQNFALGGYKQPQQLMALNYLMSLGYKFDYVINIDGFNEVALPPASNLKKRVNPFYPHSWWAQLAQFDADMNKLRSDLTQLKNRRIQIGDSLSGSPLQYSVFINTVWYLYDRVLHGNIVDLQKQVVDLDSEYTKVPFVVRGPKFNYQDDAEMYQRLSRVWYNSSRQMSLLVEGNGGSYLHFLQPNQYVKNSKPMSARENKAA